MTTIETTLKKDFLKLRSSNTVVICLHLNNSLANVPLKVIFNGVTLPHEASESHLTELCLTRTTYLNWPKNRRQETIYNPHNQKVDIPLNETMKIIIGCIRSSPVFWLLVYSGKVS